MTVDKMPLHPALMGLVIHHFTYHLLRTLHLLTLYVHHQNDILRQETVVFLATFNALGRYGRLQGLLMEKFHYKLHQFLDHSEFQPQNLL